MAEINRYAEPGLERFAPVQSERFMSPESDRYEAVGADRFDPVERDKAENSRARQLRLRQRMSRLVREGRSEKASALGAVQQAQQLVKQAKTFKNIFTVAGALASLTIIGIIWTLVQWNIQAIFTIFGLPGKDFIGLSWWLVPIIILADFILGTLIAMLMLAGYFFSHPGTTVCAVPELAKAAAANAGFFEALGLKIVAGVCNIF